MSSTSDADSSSNDSSYYLAGISWLAVYVENMSQEWRDFVFRVFVERKISTENFDRNRRNFVLLDMHARGRFVRPIG